jgi:multiple sugar transport system substrate-binding protein
MVALSNGLRNVPTTSSSAKSPDLKPDPNFETFVKMYSNPNTTTTPVTAAGSANQELFNTFVDKWQAGRVTDLDGGLAGVSKEIDAQLANAEGEQVP